MPALLHLLPLARLLVILPSHSAASLKCLWFCQTQTRSRDAKNLVRLQWWAKQDHIRAGPGLALAELVGTTL